MYVHHIIGQPWAVTPEIAEHVQALLSTEGFAGLRHLAELRVEVQPGGRRRLLGEVLSPDDIQAAKGAGGSQAPGVAVLPIMGMITMRGAVIDCAQTTSALGLAAAVRQLAAAPDVSAIVLEVDSPGGQVLGMPELAKEIRDARAQKPIVASVNGMAASAAYWAAAQATEIIVTPSGIAGSIGVYSAHVDRSKELETLGRKVTLIYAGKYKVEGHPYGPLGDEATAAEQSEINRYYDAFTADVAKGRGVAVDQVRSGFGQGRTVGARAAVDGGMADGIGTLDEAIRRAAQLGREQKRASRSSSSSIAAVQMETYRRQR